MTRFNCGVIAAAVACITQSSEARPKMPSPVTWMRDKADTRLDMSLKEFFQSLKQEDPADENTIDEIFVKGKGKSVTLPGGDVIISDYIPVDDWLWNDQETKDDSSTPPSDDSMTTDQRWDYWEQAYGEQDSLYFAMAKSRRDPETDPLVIWLQGGPGCSSMLGLYTENGPKNYKFQPNHVKQPFALENNEWSWSNEANVMYVDQPLGTGFSFYNSFQSLRWTEDSISEDFYNFLHNFMIKYPEFKGREIYITGESYAGHYIPNIARKLQLKEDPWINLAGIAIGNGWVDPFYQFAAYPQFATTHNLISYGHYMVLKWGYQLCQFALIFHVPFVTSTYCTVVGMTVVSPGLPDFNIYDIREPCVRMGLCYPDDHLWQMLNTYEYRDMMNIPSDQGDAWEECATLPHLTLMVDFETSWGYTLAPLLDAGVPVLIYNGDMDYICNWMGGYDWTSALVWDGQQEFNREHMQEWESPSNLNAPGGAVRNFENFTFLRVFNAGHMVPTDQPQAAWDMLTEFIRTKKISPSEDQPQFENEPDQSAAADSNQNVEEVVNN